MEGRVEEKLDSLSGPPIWGVRIIGAWGMVLRRDISNGLVSAVPSMLCFFVFTNRAPCCLSVVS